MDPILFLVTIVVLILVGMVSWFCGYYAGKDDAEKEAAKKLEKKLSLQRYEMAKSNDAVYFIGFLDGKKIAEGK